jgi:hypothetical protein
MKECTKEGVLRAARNLDYEIDSIMIDSETRHLYARILVFLG